MTTTYRNYINGTWTPSGTKQTFSSVNPAKPSQTLGRFQESDENDARDAIEAAEDAFPRWSGTPAPKRGELLLKAAGLLRKDKERLARLVTTEMGKVLSEARGDVQEAIDIFEYMAGEGRRLFGHTTPSELPDKFCMTLRRPVGVVGLITPWNFPTAIPAWKLAPALVCGNTIVIKPASDTPLCAIELIKMLEKAGLPKGVVNLVTGPGETVGMELVRNKHVQAVSFTGSRATGERIAREAGTKKLGLEMGGKNPILVMDDADLPLAIEGIIWGGYGTTGQRCTAASRVIIHKAVAEKLTKGLLNKIKALRIGPGIDPKTDVGPLINEDAVEKAQRYVDIGKEEGAKILIGGEKPRRDGYYYPPTLFSRCTTGMRVCQDEIFGPIVSLITVDTLDEAIDAANSIDYGLSSAIYTKDVRNAFKAIAGLQAGLTYVNASTIGSEVHLPFGGVKGTGNGTREAGIEGIHEFSETQTVYLDYSGKLQKAQIDS